MGKLTVKPKRVKKMCPVCTEEFADLHRHMEVHLLERESNCDSCPQSWGAHLPKKGRRMERADGSVRLVDKRKDAKKRCPVCLNEFTQLLRHMDAHLLERGDNCDGCPMSWSVASKSMMKKEKSEGSVKLLHYRKKQKKKCPVCYKEFVDLSHHMEAHLLERAANCDGCGKSWTITGVKRQMKREKAAAGGSTLTVDKPRKAKKCPVCLKMVSELSSHMEVHLLERAENCDECPLSWSVYQVKKGVNMGKSRGSVAMKKADKSKYKKKKCPVCFKRVYYLREHLEVHLLEREYNCDGCPKSWTRYQSTQDRKTKELEGSSQIVTKPKHERKKKMINVNNDRIDLKCQTCGLTFKDSEVYKIHTHCCNLFA